MNKPALMIKIWLSTLLIVAFNTVLVLEYMTEGIPLLLALLYLELLGGLALLAAAKTRSCGIALVCGLLISIGLAVLLASICIASLREDL